MIGRRLVVVFAALALGAASLDCSRGGNPRAIVLITLDTTRADHLGCYGGKGAATPVLDRLASQGVRFDQAQSPVPVTLPSHASMFTGLHPPAHGVRINGMFRLPESAVTIAEILREAGFATGGIPGAFPLTGSTGIGQGFAHFDDAFPAKEGSPPDENERSAGEVTAKALAWLDGAKGDPFFIWIHYFDPHSPYAPPFPYSAQFRDRPYDGEIAYVDAEIGKVRAWLEGKGVWDDALVVVAGDHGEGLWDHGEKTHQYLAYQSTLRVPLIVKPPGPPRPRVVAEPVSLVDVAPTILEFAGSAPLPRADGIGLKGVILGGEPPRRDLYFESLAGSLIHGWAPIEGVRRGRWKLIRSASIELYDLEADAGESVDAARTDAALAADLDATLGAMISKLSSGAEGAESAAAPADPEALARLASLGYVGGTVSTQRRGGPNPRDRIHLEPDLTLGAELMRRKELPAALDCWSRVLHDDPSNRYALFNAANAAADLGRPGEALAFAERLVAAYPEFSQGTSLLRKLRGSGDAAGVPR